MREDRIFYRLLFRASLPGWKMLLLKIDTYILMLGEI